MKNANKYIVITTINKENEAINKFSAMDGWKLILVGDRKGPKEVKNKNIIFLDIEEQYKLGFDYPKNSIENHYSRKNIGYIYAIKNGATIIAESDDDNIPYSNWGTEHEFIKQNLKTFSDIKFFNVYKEFTKEHIWPRGLPLEFINSKNNPKQNKLNCEIGVWQHLADGNPDVDAIYRLTKNKEINFENNEKIGLEKNVYSAFNSQNTFWNPKAFVLMYLPHTVTFRFTDILRSYIAQRLLWEENLLLGFGPATVKQERNIHDLMKDFKDEIPMYTESVNIINILDDLELKGALSDKLLQTYEQLASENIVKKEEIYSVKSWVDDLNNLGY